MCCLCHEVIGCQQSKRGTLQHRSGHTRRADLGHSRWIWTISPSFTRRVGSSCLVRLTRSALGLSPKFTMTQFNIWRNGFIHFGAHGWTINLAALPRVGLLCIEIAAYLGWESGQVCWRSDAQSNRARRSLNSLRQGLTRLSGQLG